MYAPCINAPAHLVLERARFAKRAGAGAVLMIPGLTGFDSMRLLADDDDFGLPIVAHPAMLGGNVSARKEKKETTPPALKTAFCVPAAKAAVCFLAAG